MKYQSLYGFYWFGTCLRFLQDAPVGLELHGPGKILYNIKEFFVYLDDLQLPVTARHAHQRLDDLMDELNARDDKATVDADTATKLTKAMSAIRETLEAEIEGVGAYTTTPKRLNITHLAEHVEELFSPDTYGVLPELARFDWAEAGKCIAFERPTAGAFHILRATEGVLRWYYSLMVRRKRVSSLLWAAIVSDLRAKHLTKKYSELNNHLDHIRAAFRNPTTHPDATYDIHEVQDLWSICVEVVNRMVRILRDETRL